jgi:hypothetical protein
MLPENTAAIVVAGPTPENVEPDPDAPRRWAAEAKRLVDLIAGWNATARELVRWTNEERTEGLDVDRALRLLAWAKGENGRLRSAAVNQELRARKAEERANGMGARLATLEALVQRAQATAVDLLANGGQAKGFVEAFRRALEDADTAHAILNEAGIEGGTLAFRVMRLAERAGRVVEGSGEVVEAGPEPALPGPEPGEGRPMLGEGGAMRSRAHSAR